MWTLVALAAAATLDDAVRAADTLGVEVTLIEGEADKARASTTQARALLLPRVVAQGGFKWNGIEIVLDFAQFIPENLAGLIGDVDPIVVQRRTWLEGSVNLVQPLLDLDAFANIAAAGHAAAAADHEAAWRRLLLKQGIGRAYLGVVFAREAEQVARDAEALIGALVEQARRAEAAGVATRLAVIEAEQRLAGARRAVLEATEGRTRAESALHRLTGLDVSEPVALWAVAPASSADALIAAAIERRPDLAAARTRLRAATASRRAQDLAWAPDVTGRIGVYATQNAGFADQNAWGIGAVELNWVAFDGGYRIGKAQEGDALITQAEAAIRQVERGIEEQVRTALAAEARARGGIDAATEEVRLAEARLSAARLAFDAGVVPFVDVDRAAVGLSAARLSLLQEQVALANADLDLGVATARE